MPALLVGQGQRVLEILGPRWEEEQHHPAVGGVIRVARGLVLAGLVGLLLGLGEDQHRVELAAALIGSQAVLRPAPEEVLGLHHELVLRIEADGVHVGAVERLARLGAHDAVDLEAGVGLEVADRLVRVGAALVVDDVGVVGAAAVGALDRGQHGLGAGQVPVVSRVVLVAVQLVPQLHVAGEQPVDRPGPPAAEPLVVGVVARGIGVAEDRGGGAGVLVDPVAQGDQLGGDLRPHEGGVVQEEGVVEPPAGHGRDPHDEVVVRVVALLGRRHLVGDGDRRMLRGGAPPLAVVAPSHGLYARLEP